MIIKVEEIFDELFDTIPEYDGNNKLFFGYGEQKELNLYLAQRPKNGDHCYPLLWYNLPNTLKGNKQYVQGTFEFVLAHNRTYELINDVSFRDIFGRILYPHFSLVIQALSKAGFMLDIDSDANKYEYTNYPNYGNPPTHEGKDESIVIDIWDAIKFKVKLNVKGTACDFDKIQYDLINI